MLQKQHFTSHMVKHSGPFINVNEIAILACQSHEQKYYGHDVIVIFLEGDGLTTHQHPFSAYDQDNDGSISSDCALNSKEAGGTTDAEAFKVT